MKKVILSIILLIVLSLSAQSQEISNNTLGLRLGDNDGFGTEISYQRRLSDRNRLEADLGWAKQNDYRRYKLVGLYQWVWNVDQGFNCYTGAGGGIGSWKYLEGNKDNGIFGVLTGDVGIEYVFEFPLQISMDLKPEVRINNDAVSNDFNFDLGFSARYRF